MVLILLDFFLRHNDLLLAATIKFKHSRNIVLIYSNSLIRVSLCRTFLKVKK